MKKWKVQVKGMTTIEVIADNYEDAINKTKIEAINNNHSLDWTNIEINTKTIEVTDEKN